jgi:hypothetical protein
VTFGSIRPTSIRPTSIPRSTVGGNTNVIDPIGFRPSYRRLEMSAECLTKTYMLPSAEMTNLSATRR